MKPERFPLGKPLVEIESDGRKYPYTLARDFVYLWPGYVKWKAMDVCVPMGYQTDLLSIPKILWPVLSPSGSGCWGALPHDILYSTEYSLSGQSVSDARAMADRILYDAVLDSGAGRIRAGIIYSGVRAGGWASYKGHPPQEVTDDLQMMLEATERWSRYRPTPPL